MNMGILPWLQEHINTFSDSFSLIGGLKLFRDKLYKQIVCV